MPPATESLACFIGGFVAAEGFFGRTGSPPRFRFAVALGATDSGTCRGLYQFFGCGNVYSYSRRKPHYDDECVFVIQAIREHLAVTVPFMDVHLPESYKRVQYVAWRDWLFEYWEHDARRVRSCTVDGCDEPRRAYGLCRHHLYVVRGV